MTLGIAEKVKIVEAESVEDYIEKYYKKNRMTPTLIESYKEQFLELGYIATSHHGNITGEFIAWPYHPLNNKIDSNNQNTLL